MSSSSLTSPDPSFNAVSVMLRASSSVAAFPPSSTITADRCRASSVISAGPLPFSVSIASTTSQLLPAAQPSGCSILVITATVRFPAPLPMRTILSASSAAASSSCMNAPLPHLTSSRMASLPDASFLLMMLEAIRLGSSMVPVTSRSAYISLSALASVALCPTTAIPCVLTFSRKVSGSTDVSNPGIALSLSIVPPVMPRPRPLILAMGTPQAAASGATISVVLSPIPPVLCLSTLMPGMDDRSMVVPDACIALVSVSVSSSSRC